jgi:hypothetical protein
MKEVLSLFMFSIGALFFVIFFSTVKPATMTAVLGEGMARPLQRETFAYARLPSALLAAASWSGVEQRE